MVRSSFYVLAFVVGLPFAVGFGDLCRPADEKEGYCTIDGKVCKGDEVELKPYVMNVSKWDSKSMTSKRIGHITSYAISGDKLTWSNQLHGPHMHVRERATPEAIPPVYVFATFDNKVYRFENFSQPAADNAHPTAIKATQKMVGHALAPSTGYIVEADEGDTINGLMVAEGQPMYMSSIVPSEFYAGGVELLRPGHKKNCSMVFPKPHAPDALMGHVTNTVDCHKALGVCFFTAWKFYDDQWPIWNMTKKYGNDCLWYCIMQEGSLSNEPNCIKTAIVKDVAGTEICHKDGRGAVHGMTVGNTDPADPTKFDILLVFTGKATMSNGESSMWKVGMQMQGTGSTRDITALKQELFATDLFRNYSPSHIDVGGDHVWVDSTKKWAWISCFRAGGVGVHMVDYETGELIYSLTGIDKLLPDQYTYPSGIHGVGTFGQKGSYLAVATSSCHSVSMCIPIVPWSWPVPEKMRSAGSFVIIDLASMSEDVVKHPATADATVVV